jgi:hypothetical protein
MDLLDRIFPRLEWQGDCLIWTGPVQNKGYGYISRRERGTRLVHRIVAEQHGLVDDNTITLHSCDTPMCCNPEHLSGGTQAKNIAECIERGRFVYKAPLTVCKRGHEFTPENTRITGSKKIRQCKECARIRRRKYAALNSPYSGPRRNGLTS